MLTVHQKKIVTLATGLALAFAAAGCKPAATQGIARGLGAITGKPAPIVRTQAETLVSQLGRMRAEAAIDALKQKIDYGLASAVSLTDDEIKILRSKFLDAMCDNIAQSMRGEPMTPSGIASSTLEKIITPESIERENLARAALTLATDIVNRNDVNLDAATEVTCAAVGASVSLAQARREIH